jgi:hypothetical protein
LTCAKDWLRRPDASERLGRQVLAVEGDDRSRATLRVIDLFDVELEIDRADDAVAELFVNERLERRAACYSSVVPWGATAAQMMVRSLRLACHIRDFTVLTGHSTIAAISSHE